MSFALEISDEGRSAVTYEEFQARSHFSQEELLAYAHGHLIEDAPPGSKARLYRSWGTMARSRVP